MKIDPNNKTQASPVSPLNKPATPGGPSKAFADVLKKSMGTESTAPVAVSSPLHPTIPPLIAPSTSEVYQSTARVLDTMERYQGLLSNSNVNLRGVDEAVGALKEEIFTLEPLVDQMPESSPVKAIAQETLMTAAKEIARFDRGTYV